MRFVVDRELGLFGESVRAALAGWEPPLEPVFGTVWDERDDALAGRLAEIGWAELWTDDKLLAAAVAGALELGRAVAPLHLVDEATLGAPLAIGGRVRHGLGRETVAVPGPGQALAVARLAGGEPEPSLDGAGLLRDASHAEANALASAEAARRLRAFGVATRG